MHILGIWAQGGRLQAQVTRDGELSSVPLHGEFAWRVGQVRRCVGRFDDLRHVPCPTSEPVVIHRQCLPCSGMEDTECIFEPRCQNDPAACTCLTTFKEVPHSIYLAFHGTLPKVGLTTTRRLPYRLREQGADAYFVVQSCPDRPTARGIEKQVSYLYKIPEHRSHRETLPQLARPVPWEQIERRATDLRNRLATQYEVQPVLHCIRDHGLHQPLAGIPRRVPCEGVHRGTWLGHKGNHLVYQEAPRPDRLRPGGAPLVALKLDGLVGRHIERLD